MPTGVIQVERNLMLISDVHLGASECAEEHFKEAIALAKRRKMSVLAMGDLVENAIRLDMLSEANLPNTEQLNLAHKYLAPLADRGQLIGMISGNHELRTVKTSMLDTTAVLANALEVPYFFSGGLFQLKHGKHTYQLAAIHGRSGSRTNRFLDTQRLRQVYSHADIYAAGHNHALAHRKFYTVEAAPDGTEELRERHEVRTGTFLRWDTQYARQAVFDAGPVGCPIITFGKDDRSVHIDVDTLCWFD